MNTFKVDVLFPLTGKGAIPIDHRYLLMSAVSRKIPSIHANSDVGLHAIRGMPLGQGQLALVRSSAVVFRTPVDFLPELLPLAGKRLGIAKCQVRLGCPHLRMLQSAATLHSRIVTIKGFTEPDSFGAAVARQIEALSIERPVHIEIGKRRVVRIKSYTVVGFEVTLRELLPAESLTIQSQGLGGRRHFACGIFNAVNESQFTTPEMTKEK